MSKFFLYKFLLIVCMVAYATNFIAQTSKIPIEIHIKDKEAIISIDGTPYPGGEGKHLYNIEVSSGKHTISATKPSHTVVSKRLIYLALIMQVVLYSLVLLNQYMVLLRLLQNLQH